MAARNYYQIRFCLEAAKMCAFNKTVKRQDGMNPLLSLLLTSIAFGAIPASGQPAPAAKGQATPSVELRFDRIDVNRDGFITWLEARPDRVAEFKSADQNGDGSLNRSEFAARAVPFEAFDTNKDGLIAVEEFLSKHQEMFTAADKDGDGRVSRQEFAAVQMPGSESAQASGPKPLLNCHPPANGAPAWDSQEVGKSSILPSAGGDSTSAAGTAQRHDLPVEVRDDCPPESGAPKARKPDG